MQRTTVCLRFTFQCYANIICNSRSLILCLVRWPLQIRMKHVVLYLLCATLTCSLCCGEVTKLAAEDRKILENASRFHEVNVTSDLPPTVVALCIGDNGKIAEPGQKWNATDALIDPTLPGKRLIWAAVGGEYYIVHYESRTRFTS